MSSLRSSITVCKILCMPFELVLKLNSRRHFQDLSYYDIKGQLCIGNYFDMYEYDIYFLLLVCIGAVS